MKNYYKSNKDKYKGYRLNRKDKMKEYRQRNKEYIKQYQKEWCNRNKNKIKGYNKERALRRYYKLTIEEFEALLMKQDNKCAICGIDFINLSTKNIQIDHNHKTGKIRGILCNMCNSAIGFLSDNAVKAFNLIRYLENDGVL